MRRSYWLLSFVFSFLYCSIAAQVGSDSLPPIPQDTNRVVDSTPARRQPAPVVMPPFSPMADSSSKKPVSKDMTWNFNGGDHLMKQVMQHNPYFGFSVKPQHTSPLFRKKEGKEAYFYVLLGLLLFFAFLRQAFSKYFSNLFRLFFRTTLKYRQIREQLMQTPLPSLLLNGFFVICGGLYAAFILLHFDLIERDDFWLYFFYCALALATIYFVKFLGLKVIGWIFNLREAADSYIFIVFVINKVIGVFLLPFVIMLAFMSGTGYTVALIVSWFGIGALILYRFILSYAAVRNQVRFNPFHFLLYLLAFEIAPLLLIYKALLVFFE